MLYMLFIGIIVFVSLCHSVKLFSSQPTSFCLFSFWFSSPSHQGGGRSERVTAWFFVANRSKTTTCMLRHHSLFKPSDERKMRTSLTTVRWPELPRRQETSAERQAESHVSPLTSSLHLLICEVLVPSRKMRE